MRIKTKKIISFILSFIIIISTIIDGNVIKSAYAEDNGITRAEWINKLADTFEMSIDDTNSPDNYFSDINEDTEYFEDIMKALSYGIIDIEAGKEFKPNETASREFAAQTLNACLGYQLEENVEYTFTDSSLCQYADDDQVAVDKKWFSLIDGKFMPEKQITDAESQKMLDYALAEINKLDVSADYNSTWTVADDVKKIPENVQAIVEDNKVTITNYATNIVKDDIFVVYQGEIAVPFKAVSVSETGNTTVITTTDVDEYENAFNKVDAEGIIETEDLTFTSLDGTELEIEMEEETEPIVALYSARSGLATASSTKKIKDIKFSKTFKISGNTSSSISGTFSNIKVKYNISTSTNETFVQVEGDLNMKGSVGAAINTSINLMQIGIPGIGGVTLTADISAAAKFNSTVTTHILAGVAYSKSGGFRTIRSFKENGGSNTSVEATASLGATLKCGITDLKIISGYVYGKAGITAKIEDKVWAVDTPTNCKTFLAYMYASYGVEVSCKLIDYKYKKSVDIYTLENSPFRVYHHYEDGKPVSKCMRGLTFDYYTKYYSSYWNTGWAGCDSSYGLDNSGKPYAIYEYEVKTDASKNEYVVITKYKGNMRNLTVPETLDGYEVRGIGSNAFKGNKYIKVLTVPDCVTEIGRGAFLGCSNLSEVKLSKGLTKLGGGAFRDCDALTDICIPKSLQETTTEYYSLYDKYCNQYGVFIESDNLKNVTFEEGATEIPSGLFANNSSIESIVIPDTVTKIENNAFENCTNLKNIKMSSSLTYIGKYAFEYVKGLNKVDIPDTVTEIGAGAFLGCSNISEVKLSKGLTKFGGGAFRDCDALTDICIPKSLQETTTERYSIYDKYCNQYGVFIESDNLKNITFEEGTTEIANGLFAHNSSIESIVIPDTVEKIEDMAFENCSALKQIKLSDKLESIGKEAFYGAVKLEKIEIPNTVIGIGNGCFKNCTSLSYVKLPNTRENITEYMFYGCASLKNITLPDTVKYIRKSAFEGSGLTSIKMSPNVTIIEDRAFTDTPLESVEFSGEETSIGNEAFKNCDELQSLTLPNSVTYLGSGAFQDCDTLKEIKLSTGITSILLNTFEHCDVLQSIVIPYKVKEIKDYAFANSPKLKEVTIPKSTTTISSNAFSYPAITTVYGITGTYAETYANEKGMNFVNKEVSASKITLSQTEITMNVKSTKELILDITPFDFTDEVDWKTSDSKVVTVDENGNVKAVGIGTATIKVTAGNASATCKVNVVQPITYIGLNKYSLDLECGETYRLVASISPWNANNKDVEWSSSDDKVVTVDRNGDIKAIGKGKAVITVTAKDGSGVSAKCEVTVLNNSYVITDVSKLESSHPYENNCKDVWTYTVKDAQALEITFDEKTEIEDGFDNLIILDVNNKQIGTYTGKELSGKTITVSGNTVKIKLDTDNGGSTYGFKVSSIKVVEQNNTIYGDTNNDAEINIKDSALIKRYLAGIEVEINENAADVDGDGKITIKDSALVKRHLAGWEVEFTG